MLGATPVAIRTWAGKARIRMLPWIITLQWLHVLLGIFWFGGTLFLDFAVVPAVMGLPVEKQREVSVRLGQQVSPLMRTAGAGVIVLGFIRGTFLGPLHSVQAVFGSAYGFTWLAALAVATGLFFFALFVTEPAARSLSEDQSADVYAVRMQRIKLITLTELLFFAVIFSCMILMRFGL